MNHFSLKDTSAIFPKALVLLFIVISIGVSIKEGLTEDVHGDFYIFWSAGVNFGTGNDLYSRIGGGEEFLYPPFAPMVFQIFSLTPFNYAVTFFSFLNFGLWVLSFYIVKQILLYYFPDRSLTVVLWLTAITTIRFFWHNIIWVNINEIVLTSVLLSILFYLRKKETLSILCLCFGVWLKIMPILLLIIILIKSPFRVWIRCASILILPILLILSQRGYQRGTQDFTDFYFVVIQPFLHGKVYTAWISFSLSSLVFKLLTSHPDIDGIKYNILSLSHTSARIISTTLQIIVLVTIIGRTLHSKYIKKEANISVQEWALGLLGMLLLAGVSWEGHHVTMVLVYPIVLLTLSFMQKDLKYFMVMSFCILTGFLTYDIIGSYLYNFFQAFSIITFLMIYLFVTVSFSPSIFPNKPKQS